MLSDLARVLRDGVTHHEVNTNHRKQQRNTGKDTQQRRVETLVAHRVLDHEIHGSHSIDRLPGSTARTSRRTATAILLLSIVERTSKLLFQRNVRPETIRRLPAALIG